MKVTYQDGYNDAVKRIGAWIDNWFQYMLDNETGEYRIKWNREHYKMLRQDFHETFEMVLTIDD